MSWFVNCYITGFCDIFFFYEYIQITWSSFLLLSFQVGNHLLWISAVSIPTERHERVSICRWRVGVYLEVCAFIPVRYFSPQFRMMLDHFLVVIGNNDLLMFGPTGSQGGTILLKKSISEWIFFKKTTVPPFIFLIIINSTVYLQSAEETSTREWNQNDMLHLLQCRAVSLYQVYDEPGAVNYKDTCEGQSFGPNSDMMYSTSCAWSLGVRQLKCEQQTITTSLRCASSQVASSSSACCWHTHTHTHIGLVWSKYPRPP